MESLKLDLEEERELAKEKEELLRQDIENKQRKIAKMNIGMHFSIFIHSIHILDISTLKAQLDEKDLLIDKEIEGRKSDKRDFEKQLARLQNEIEQKNDQLENMAATNSTMKDIHSKLKQQIVSLEQKSIGLEAELLKQVEEKEEFKRNTKMDKTKEGHELKTLVQRIQELEEELNVSNQAKLEREEKIKALFEESKKMKQTILTLEDEVIDLKEKMEEEDQHHSVQLKKLVENHLEENKGVRDVRTLKVTVELLQEQVQKVREEKKQYEEQALLYAATKRREMELETLLDTEKRAKEEAAKELKVAQGQYLTAQTMVEFYKNQFEEWKKVHSEQKDHWKKEIDLASESLRSRVLELELEKEQMYKQVAALHSQKNEFQDFAESQLVRSVRSKERPVTELPAQPGYTDIFDALRENYRKRAYNYSMNASILKSNLESSMSMSTPYRNSNTLSRGAL